MDDILNDIMSCLEKRKTRLQKRNETILRFKRYVDRCNRERIDDDNKRLNYDMRNIKKIITNEIYSRICSLSGGLYRLNRTVEIGLNTFIRKGILPYFQPCDESKYLNQIKNIEIPKLYDQNITLPECGLIVKIQKGTVYFFKREVDILKIKCINYPNEE